MGVDVDGAGHDDLAGDVVGLIGFAAVRARRGDAAIVDEDVARRVAAVHGIDDAAALKPDHHARASGLPSRSAILPSTSATVGAPPLGLVALTMPIPAMDQR